MDSLLSTSQAISHHRTSARRPEVPSISSTIPALTVLPCARLVLLILPWLNAEASWRTIASHRFRQ